MPSRNSQSSERQISIHSIMHLISSLCSGTSQGLRGSSPEKVTLSRVLEDKKGGAESGSSIQVGGASCAEADCEGVTLCEGSEGV